MKSAAESASSFAELVVGIMALPLTDAEKAEAVRRLMDAAKRRDGGR